VSLTSRKSRPLNREIDHLNDTSIIWVAIEGAEKVSKEHKYFKIFQKRDRRYQLKIIGNENNRSSPEYIIGNLKEEIENFEIREDDDFWLVIDVDRWGQKKLKEVAGKCVDCNSGLAVSNPCFEIWLLYHFQEIECKVDSAGKAKKLLHEAIEDLPNHNDDYKALYNEERIREAIKRAQKDDIEKEARWPNQTGSRVYRIVESILAQES